MSTTSTAPTLAPASSTASDGGDAPVLLAVSYLRVSTREQAERGGTDEGFSIPAQRDANQRKADELGARIVHEFVDAGESARSADRDGLKELLAFIAASRVNFCIVHKLDRLARNRADDVAIHQALLSAGVTLVSATESIDQTPSGMLVHGIMSSIAEFYSRNLATEVSKGLSQKIAQGGTPMRAPIGYLNVRRTDDQGHEIRTVEVDPDRAPLIRWAFEHYAEGETSVTGLLRDLTARGLVTVPTPKRPSKPLGKNTLYKLLTNPYYAGVIRYKDALYPGAHEPLIEPALFDQVQSLLKARTAKQTRHVQHAHHLKGLLHCGTCGSRMLLDFATNPRGTTYAYYICSGRAAKKTICDRRAVPVAVAERLVADSYTSITISDQTYERLAAEVDAAFDTRMAGRDEEIADLMANRAKLEAESDKLLAAHFADAIDLPTLKRHQDRIRAGLADVNQRLAEHDEHHTGGRAFLHDSLRLLTDAHHVYARSGDADRRLANQAFYTRLDITDDEQLRPHLAEPFATILHEAHDRSDDDGENAKREHPTSTDVACSRKTLWVELGGFEPPTFSLRTRRATNCAIAPEPCIRIALHHPVICTARGGPGHRRALCSPGIRRALLAHCAAPLEHCLQVHRRGGRWCRRRFRGSGRDHLDPCRRCGRNLGCAVVLGRSDGLGRDGLRRQRLHLAPRSGRLHRVHRCGHGHRGPALALGQVEHGGGLRVLLQQFGGVDVDAQAGLRLRQLCFPGCLGGGHPGGTSVVGAARPVDLLGQPGVGDLCLSCSAPPEHQHGQEQHTGHDRQGERRGGDADQDPCGSGGSEEDEGEHEPPSRGGGPSAGCCCPRGACRSGAARIGGGEPLGGGRVHDVLRGFGPRPVEISATGLRLWRDARPGRRQNS